MSHSNNVIFWGAGATAALGIRTTVQQASFLQALTGATGPGMSLKERIAKALGPKNVEPWSVALFDLITILGDNNDAYRTISSVNDEQLSSMRRNWTERATDSDLQSRILGLRLTYDWSALKSILKLCPGSSTPTFRLNDLFNILDMHIPSGFGVRADVQEGAAAPQFLETRRLIGAKNALMMILSACFYIDYQLCVDTQTEVIEQYRAFAELLGQHTQALRREGDDAAAFDRPAFYKSDVSFVSLNYDPIGLWIQFVANRDLNRRNANESRDGSTPALQLFHDFGHLIPARRIGKGPSGWPWYPLNEAVAQRLNEQPNGTFKVRLTKFLFPHGCLCWRECPNCGKLSAYHGDAWDLQSRSLFPPPPLKSFEQGICPAWIQGREREQREKGAVDARGCLHCGTLTFTQRTQAVMQSSFKSRPPSFIEEIQRELRVTTMQANHIILMGYSLPQDDVTYRAFFSASCRRPQGKDEQPVRCTVVGKNETFQGWYGPSELNPEDFPSDHAVNSAIDIFGRENVRFYGGGIPNVFLDSRDRVTGAALKRLLSWSNNTAG